VRRLSLVAGAALIAIALGAASFVADTREGLIAEVVTLMAGLSGVSLLLYGLLAGSRRAPRPAASAVPVAARAPSSRDFTIGTAGFVLAAILIGGLAVSAGWQWAALAAVMLLPMIAGSAFLCGRFLRARQLTR
jgi:hypothetical protein